MQVVFGYRSGMSKIYVGFQGLDVAIFEHDMGFEAATC